MSDAITPDADAPAQPEAPEEASSAAVSNAEPAPTTTAGLADPSDAEDSAAPTMTAGLADPSGAEDSAAPTTTAGLADPSGSEDTARENPRKVREGIVVSNTMDKTAVVESIDRVRHRRYAKTVQRTTKLFVHDEDNDANLGDRVRVQETRPLSKKKRWRLVEIIERAR